MIKILIYSLFVSTTLFAGITNNPYIEGIVNSFDDKTVILITDSGKIIVPRNAFKSDQKIKGGNRVIAFFEPADLKEELSKEKLKRK